MPIVYLNKGFLEIGGLELVTIHWIAHQPDLPPDWRSARSMVLQAAKTNGAAIRRATVPVEVSGEGPWTLHYFFEWVRRGVTQGSPAYFEQIVARPITHLEQ